MTFDIFVGISFSSLLLFPGHGDIQNVSYTAQRQTDPSLKNKRFLVAGCINVLEDKDVYDFMCKMTLLTVTAAMQHSLTANENYQLKCANCLVLFIFLFDVCFYFCQRVRLTYVLNSDLT